MKRRLGDRVIAFLLLIMMILTNFNGVIAFAADEVGDNTDITVISEEPTEADTDDSTEHRLSEEELLSNYENSMHFIIRHWHNSEDENAKDRGNQSNQKVGNRYFVVGEGYIVQESEENYKAYLFRYTEDGEQYLEDIQTLIDENSPYFTENGFNSETGELEFCPYPINGEVFAGFSISTGQNAAEIKDNNLIIKYDSSIRLVKSHVFYTKSDVVSGAPDVGVFDNRLNPEQDTEWIYVYTENSADHTPGEVVQLGDYSFLTKDQEDLIKEAELEGEVELRKVYDTNLGLHTDKTASEYTSVNEETGAVESDGRRFNIDLETWNSEGKIPEIAMVLDASGSMAFASDIPRAININDLEGILDNEDLELLKSKQGIIRDSGFFKDSIDSLKGYYQFNQQPPENSNLRNGDNRTWFLNSKTGGDPEKYNLKNPDPTHFAQLIKQPEEDGEINYTNGIPVFNWVDGKALKPDTTSWGTFPMSFSASLGMFLDFKDTQGFLLEQTVEENSDFTLSFKLAQDTENYESQNDEILEILYIGEPINNRDSQNYFHLYRQNNDLIAKMGDYDREELFRIKNLYKYNSKSSHILTLTFSNNNFNVYVDNDLVVSNVSGEDLSGRTIVFAPFKDDISNDNSKHYLCLDNIYLFDEALSPDGVAKLNTISGSSLEDSHLILSENFLNSEELKLLMDPSKTDNSLLGFGGYSYFVYDAASVTQEYNPLAYYTSEDNFPPNQLNINGNGWYYINCTSWGSLSTNGTAKRIIGLEKDSTFSDSIAPTGTEVQDSFNGAAPDFEVEDREKIENGNTGESFKAVSNSPTKFYIDSEGYLRCFFNNNNSNLTSYVYELDDDDYIKKETLQRALSAFLTDLSSVSPASRVSAVRYSDGNADRDKLIMLDWTKDIGESIGIMNLKRGNGTAYSGDGTDPTEYNYVLTGGTYAITGLEAFKNSLLDRQSSDAERYLILFTDGADNNIGKDQSTVELADTLKKEGYTVFTVMLNGGPVHEKGNRYEEAHDFLLKLSGTSETNTTKEKEEYFFSIDKAKREKSQEDTDNTIDTLNENDADILTEIFADQILDEITNPLDNYRVKDYIDPRFDLVDKDGDVWHLNKNGSVKVDTSKESKTNSYELKNQAKGVAFKTTSTDYETQNAFLNYDQNNDLYYIEWRGQDIPTSFVGADRLYVWKSRITVQAKEDFIGGNAILTNGNGANMNYVFKPHKNGSEEGISSGTDQSVKDEDNENPSKGFPRVTVNVKPSDKNIVTTQIKYLGEELSSEEVINSLFSSLDSDDFDEITKESTGLMETQDLDNESETNQTETDKTGLSKYYLKYLKRFIKFYSNHELPVLLDEQGQNSYDKDLLDALKVSGKFNLNSIISILMGKSNELEIEDLPVLTDNTIKIPYSYLFYESNSAGSDLHQSDYLGYLNYTIKESVDGVLNTDPNTDIYILRDTRERESVFEIEFEAISLSERKDSVNSLIIEEKKNQDEEQTESPVMLSGDSDESPLKTKVYSWNSDLKPAQGETVTSEEIESSNITQVVSGDIVLLVNVPDTVASSLNSFTYKATLKSGNKVIGTFEVSPESLESGTTYTAEFSPTPEYTDEAVYGLPIGTYSLEQNEDETILPLGYEIGLKQFLQGESLYAHSGEFEKGSGINEENFLKSYAASIQGDKASLGYIKDENNQEVPNARFALYQVDINENVGSLIIEKTVEVKNGTLTDADKAKLFTFNIDLDNKDINGTYDGVIFTAGKATITLKHGENKEITGLPAGINYTVTEKSVDDYSCSSSGSTGIIVKDTVKTASFTNTRIETGNLVIGKTVTVTNGSLTAKDLTTGFKFTVKLSDSSINGKYGDITFENGAATVTLNHDNKLTATGLPAGITFTVTETDSKGYTPDTNAKSGTIPINSNAEVSFINTRIATGDLIIKKTVEVENGTLTKADRDAEFTFKVELSNKDISGQYGELDFTNGTATITLKHGGSLRATDLPAGIDYTITEISYGEYIPISEEITGSITDGTTAEAEFTNKRVSLGSLTISKTVEVTNGSLTEADRTQAFTFTITLYKDQDHKEKSNFTGILNDVVFSNGVGTLNLKHNESKTIDGIPNGLYYEVVESESEDYSQDTTGNKSGQISELNNASVAFKNKRSATGSLSISKTVILENSAELTQNDLDKEFTFTITLYTDSTYQQKSDFNETLNGVEFKNGVGRIYLKHSQSKTIDGISAGLYYKVGESNNEGYTVGVTGNKGQITDGSLISADFTNTRSEITGSFIISKTIEGNEESLTQEDRDTEFTFEVTLSDLTISGIYGDLEFTNGQARTTLKHGENVTASGLPLGITYTVTETDSGNFTPDDPTKTDEVSEESKNIHFVNRRPEPQTGSLEISKTVKVDNGELTPEDEEKDFVFTIRLFNDSSYEEPADFNGEYNGIEFNAGVGSFTLKHGQSITVSEIPENLYYRVEESGNNEYTVTTTNNTQGQISANSIINISFTNTRTAEPEKPSKKVLSPENGTPVRVGDLIIYEITWKNTLSESANVIISDSLSDSVSFVEASHSGEYDKEHHTVTWDLGPQVSGLEGSVKLTVKVESDDILYIENIADVTVGDLDPVPTNKVETPVWTPVKSEPTPGEGKTVVPENEITYEITWKNYKEDKATIVITDPLDNGVEFVNASDNGKYDKNSHTVLWTLDNVESKAEGKVTLTVKVNEEAFETKEVKNWATVKVSDDPEIKTNVIENPTWKPDKTIKGANPDNSLKVGDHITYQINWKNYKSEVALVTVTDKLDQGVDFVYASDSGQYDRATHTVTWNLGQKDPGEGGTIELVVQINNKAVQSGKTSNTGQVKVGDDPSINTNEVTTTVEDPSGAVLLSKTQKLEGKDNIFHTNDRSVNSGDTITYNLEAKNTKDVQATGVVIIDTIPENLYFNRDSVSIKTTTGLTQNSTYKYIAETGELIINIDTLEPQEVVNISFNAVVGHNTKESWWINHAYLTYDNIGEEQVFKAKNLNSIMGLFSKLFSVNAAGEINSQIQSRTDHDDSYMNGIPLEAVVYHSNDQIKNGIYKYSADLRIFAKADEEPDVPTIVKEQSSANNSRTRNQIIVNRDETMTYYLTVTNPSPETITNITVSDTIPIGLEYVVNSASSNGIYNNGTITWNIVSIAPNGSYELKFNVKVPNNEAYFHWENTAEMNWNGNTTGQEISSNTVISDTPQLNIKKEQSTSGQLTVDRTEDYIEFIPGDVITYYITVTNISNVPAHNVVIKDPAPLGMTFIPESATSGVKIENNVLIWTIDELLPGNKNTIEVSFSCDLPDVVDDPIYFHNIAYVSWNENGPNNPLSSNETILGDPPNNSGGEEPITPSEPGNSSTNTETTIKKTTTTTTSQSNVSQVGVSPQTGVVSGLSVSTLIGITALSTYLNLQNRKRRKRKEDDN